MRTTRVLAFGAISVCCLMSMSAAATPQLNKLNPPRYSTIVGLPIPHSARLVKSRSDLASYSVEVSVSSVLKWYNELRIPNHAWRGWMWVHARSSTCRRVINIFKTPGVAWAWQSKKSVVLMTITPLGRGDSRLQFSILDKRNLLARGAASLPNPLCGL
jgi:hypothetical protein